MKKKFKKKSKLYADLSCYETNTFEESTVFIYVIPSTPDLFFFIDLSKSGYISHYIKNSTISPYKWQYDYNLLPKSLSLFVKLNISYIIGENYG